MKKIFKYQISDYGKVSIDLPRDALILHIDSQDDVICFWALIDPDESTITRSFIAVPTGQAIPEYMQASYIGTALVFEGKIVFHVFEVAK